jgi:hypothetical protein
MSENLQLSRLLSVVAVVYADILDVLGSRVKECMYGNTICKQLSSGVISEMQNDALATISDN